MKVVSTDAKYSYVYAPQLGVPTLKAYTEFMNSAHVRVPKG